MLEYRLKSQTQTVDDKGVTRHGAPITGYFAQAIAATALVVFCPALTVWALRAAVVDSTPLAVLIGVTLSLGGSLLGGRYWMNSGHSGDVLFSDLMIWGWLRRWRAERNVTAALEVLGRDQGAIDANSAAATQPLEQLAQALECGDPYTRGHSRRVARYASMTASRMGLSSDEVGRIRLAAALHDVGKVHTPTEILHKPGRLTDEEYTTVKRHPVDGARLVQALDDPALTAIVRHHHERLDGKGYPSGLSGDEIPIGARIIAVADTFDAITSARPYRDASPHKKALAILAKEAGTQLDADAVRAFRSCYTGRRPLALWATVTAVPHRLTSWLSAGNAASALSITKAVVAASTVAVVGSASGAAARRPILRPRVSLEAAARAVGAGAPRTNVAPTARVASGAPSGPPPARSTAGTGSRLSTGTVQRTPMPLSGGDHVSRLLSHRQFGETSTTTLASGIGHPAASGSGSASAQTGNPVPTTAGSQTSSRSASNTGHGHTTTGGTQPTTRGNSAAAHGRSHTQGTAKTTGSGTSNGHRPGNSARTATSNGHGAGNSAGAGNGHGPGNSTSTGNAHGAGNATGTGKAHDAGNPARPRQGATSASGTGPSGDQGSAAGSGKSGGGSNGASGSNGSGSGSASGQSPAGGQGPAPGAGNTTGSTSGPATGPGNGQVPPAASGNSDGKTAGQGSSTAAGGGRDSHGGQASQAIAGNHDGQKPGQTAGS
jgi:HD domain